MPATTVGPSPFKFNKEKIEKAVTALRDVVAEEDRPKDWNLAENRNFYRRDSGGRLSHHGPSQEPGEAGSKQCEGQTANNLFCPKANAHEGVQLVST